VPGSLLVFLLCLLAGAFVFLFLFSASANYLTLRREENDKKTAAEIGREIDKFIDGAEGEYREGFGEFARYVRSRDKRYRNLLEKYLLNALKSPADSAKGKRYGEIAENIRFSAESLAQKGGGNSEIYAINQYDVLMGLARIGKAESMREAFEKIKNGVFINERAVIEVLSSFPAGGEKTSLFRSMINSDTHYISALFLKATDGETVKTLDSDIIKALHHVNKEVRAAAAHALSKLGAQAPSGELVSAMEDREWEVRAIAAKALGSVMTGEAGMALFRALFDRQWRVRQNAAKALIGHPDYEQLFILASESRDEYARDSIISALENGNNPVLLRSIKVMAV